MLRDEANKLKKTIEQETLVDIIVQSVIGKRPKISLTSNQTPEGFLVWVKTKDEGEVFFTSYKEWERYISMRV